MIAFTLAVLTGCGGGDGVTDPANGGGTGGPSLASLRVTPSTLSLIAGQSGSITAQALDASGTVIANVTGFSFTSSNPSIAEAGSSGSLLGIGAGTANITVSLTRDGVTATAAAGVTVTGSLPAVATVTAGANANTFSPATIVVARNAVVTFSFGSLIHNVTYGSTTGAPGNIANVSNTTVARTFTTAGNFVYDCTIHPGMRGEVKVR